MVPPPQNLPSTLPAFKPAPAGPTATFTAYVGKMPPDFPDHIIRNMLEQCGTVFVSKLDMKFCHFE